MALGPYVLVNTALAGFFGLAAVLSLWQWISSRHDKTMLVFSIHCFLCVATTVCISVIATATTAAASDAAMHWRVTFGLASRAATVWLLIYLTGFYFRPYCMVFIG